MISEEQNKQLQQIGLHRYSDDELLEIQRAFAQQISIGVARDGSPTTEDGGVMAIPSSVEPIRQEQVNQVPDNSPVITAACGGTNWFFTLGTKQSDGTVTIKDSASRTITESERTHTFTSLMDIIAEGVASVATEYGVEEHPQLPVAISFGFPQINIRLENGDIDARLPTGDLPKKWKITDYDPSLSIEEQPSLAGILRQELQQRGVKDPGVIIINNDTVAVATDVQHEVEKGIDLPVGFVFGTGTNACVFAGTEKGIINLEAGHATSMKADSIHTQMQQNNYVELGHVIMEHWVGGGMLPYRLAAAFELLGEDELQQVVLDSEDQAFVSHAAEGIVGTHISQQQKDLLQECAARVLTQAGQLIGVFIATVSSAAGYESGKAHVPYEGSLLKKGYRVQKTVQETVSLLLPESDIEPYVASGMVGLAKLALVKQHVAP